ncbi:MAG TPA: RluA family pseudouridine synthase [Ramlibacter sp.]|nr:RluA family pseudouridine synthase [Ramlibacter sp.]
MRGLSARCSAPRILFADPHLIVAEKPAGLLSVPGRGADKQDCVSARVQRQYPEALVVHRLDMATSGLLLMARGAQMQRQMSLAFSGREVDKRYIAVVAGLVMDDEGTVDLPLIADWPNRPKQIVEHSVGKPSRTRWRVLARDIATNTTRVELEPVTGRTHQLRVHMMAIGHPIAGDALYAPLAVQELAPRLMLHASRLEFAHPATAERMRFDSRAPF